MDLDLIKLIATVVAFVAAASKLLKATVPFWGSMPPVVQRFLPGAVLVLGALPDALAGVNTWPDLGVAVLGALALALPGRHTNIPVPHPPETKVPPTPPLGPVAAVLLAIVVLNAQACRPQQSPCTDADLAAIVAQCRARVEAECRDVPDNECPAVAECDEKVAGWERCGGEQ